MPAGVFRATDGELMVVVGNDGQFARTCEVLGAPELATDPKFLKNNDRVVHGKEIMAIFAGLFLKKPVAYWLDELEKAGVPCGAINSIPEVFDQEQIKHRKMRMDLGWLAGSMQLYRGDGLYKVHAGPYPSRGEAERAAERIRQELGFTPFVLKR